MSTLLGFRTKILLVVQNNRRTLSFCVSGQRCVVGGPFRTCSESKEDERRVVGSVVVGVPHRTLPPALQVYLAHTETQPPRTLQYGYA